MTWLDDDRYRWIREHLAQREDDELLYTPQAAGRAESAPPLPTSISELVRHAARAAQEEDDPWTP